VFCHAQYWWSLLRGSASMVWGILPLSLNHLSSVCRVSVVSRIRSRTWMQNVRRRIYDALNVLEAIGVVQKGSKNITWVGWPAELNQAGGGLRMGEMAIARLFARRDALLQRLTTRLEKNQQQAVKLLCLCNLINRNKDAILPLLLAAQKGGYDAPNPFPVPFMMILAPETAKTDVFISDDAHRAEIIFNDGVRYDVYDDCGVLQLMGLGVPSGEETARGTDS
jgi:hypothetical protein